MKKIAIVDYGLGNIFSIRQALLSCDVDVVVTDSPEKIKNSHGVLLPGVGAFSEAMKRLNQSGLNQVIQSEAKSGKPLLGICLGLQLLFDKSNEFGQNQGLGLISGEVIRFPESYKGSSLNIPFIGWNKIVKTESSAHSALLEGIAEQEKYYFVHSYHVSPKDTKCVLANCNYLGYIYPAILQHENISGVQGHPEKSGQQGLQLYKNWIKN